MLLLGECHWDIQNATSPMPKWSCVHTKCLLIKADGLYVSVNLVGPRKVRAMPAEY